MRRDLPINNTIWQLFGYVVNLEAEVRVIREEDRGLRHGAVRLQALEDAQ
jgi:hypothetical protein